MCNRFFPQNIATWHTWYIPGTILLVAGSVPARRIGLGSQFGEQWKAQRVGWLLRVKPFVSSLVPPGFKRSVIAGVQFLVASGSPSHFSFFTLVLGMLLMYVYECFVKLLDLRPKNLPSTKMTRLNLIHCFNSMI